MRPARALWSVGSITKHISLFCTKIWFAVAWSSLRRCRLGFWSEPLTEYLEIGRFHVTSGLFWNKYAGGKKASLISINAGQANKWKVYPVDMMVQYGFCFKIYCKDWEKYGVDEHFCIFCLPWTAGPCVLLFPFLCIRWTASLFHMHLKHKVEM